MGKRKYIWTPEGFQRCYECRIIKEPTDFEPCRWRPEGITSTCRDCLAYARETRAMVMEVVADSCANQYAPTPLPDDYAPEVYEGPPKAAHSYYGIDASRRRARLHRLACTRS